MFVVYLDVRTIFAQTTIDAHNHVRSASGDVGAQFIAPLHPRRAGEETGADTNTSVFGLLRCASLRNQSETCVGCIVSSITASRCSRNWLKSTSLRKVALNEVYHYSTRCCRATTMIQPLRLSQAQLPVHASPSCASQRA